MEDNSPRGRDHELVDTAKSLSILHDIARTPGTHPHYVFSEQSSLLASEDLTGSDCHHPSDGASI